MSKTGGTSRRGASEGGAATPRADGPHAPVKTVNVAFAGHIRESDLVDTAVCAARIGAALRLLREAGIEHGRLLVGAADGADALATQAWIEAGLGSVHIAHPFLGERHRFQATSETWLDGERTLRSGGNPHLDQTRWLLAYADLVIVLWNGAAARGAGGTADIVMLGLAKGAPILWISTDPQDVPLRLLPSSYIESDVLELRAAIQETAEAPAADAAGLAARLVPRDLGADSDGETWIARALARTLWRTFALFRGLLGSVKKAPPSPAAPSDLQEQSGFAALSRIADDTSDRAGRLADVHRSEQVLLLILALAATVLGASPAVFPAARLWSSLAELGLILIGVVIWLSAGRTHRHERWTETRCHAEWLRSQRVAWVLGMSPPASAGDPTLAAVDPPTGAYDRDRVRRWGEWAVAQLIEGQAAYHADQAAVGDRISRRLKSLETATLIGLIASLAVFGLAHLLRLDSRVPAPLTGLMIMIGAVGPAVGAACMTLEARFGFEEQRGRSLDLAERFDQLAKRLPHDGSLAQLQSIALVAMELVSREAQTWRYGAERRRLSRGG